MRAVVTGGFGFIGSNLIHDILHRSGQAPPTCCPDHAAYSEDEALEPWTILNLDLETYAASRANLAGLPHSKQVCHEVVDVADADKVGAILANFEPDIILHLAAESHVDRSIESGGVFARTNVVGTQVLLDAARRYDVEHFVHISTDEVYGSIATGAATETSPLRPSSPYSASKAASDLLALAHAHTYGLPVTVTRCTNNFGPRQHPEKLVPKVFDYARRRLPIPVYGSGLQSRDWLYVKDHCRALVHVALRRPGGDIFNISGGTERTNLEMIRAIGQVLGQDLPVSHVHDRPGHDHRYALDDSKLRATGFKPRVSFTQGLTWTSLWEASRVA